MLFPEPPDLLSSLPPPDRVIAELKALLGLPVVAKAVFPEIVRAVSAAAPDGRVWSIAKVNESVERLKQKRVLGDDGAIAPAWRDPLTLRVIRRPDGAALAKAVHAAAPKSWREQEGYYWRAGPIHNDVDLARSVRLMALANDAAEVERLIGIAERAQAEQDGDLPIGSLLLQGCPVDLGFIDGLTPALRDRVVTAHVELLIGCGALDGRLDAVIETVRKRDWDWTAAPRLDRALMRLDLLGERPDAASARIARVRASDPVGARAGEAALRFLTGSADSLPLFREALKQHRKAAGRRRAALPHEFGVYHLLALLAAGDVNLHGEISTLLQTMQDTRPVIAWAFFGLLELVSGRDDRAKQWSNHVVGPRGSYRGPGVPLDAAVITLALAVIDATKLPPRESEDRRAIERWGGQARLPARIMSLAYARVSPKPESWRETLESLGPGYDRRFLDIVPIRPAWERVLDKLQALLAPPAVAKTEAPAKSRRLVFLFDAATAQITALEQTSKRDGWNSGRQVSLRRLHKRDPKLDYLTPEDQQVLNAIKSRSGYEYYDEGYEFDRVRGPLALIGHDRVFDAGAPDRHIEVIAYPPELVVREVRGRIRIELSHGGDEPRVFVEKETPARMDWTHPRKRANVWSNWSKGTIRVCRCARNSRAWQPRSPTAIHRRSCRSRPRVAASRSALWFDRLGRKDRPTSPASVRPRCWCRRAARTAASTAI
jgi:hypothetical protein